MRNNVRAVVLVGVVAGLMMVPTTAFAEGNGARVGAYHQLRLERFGQGTFAAWQRVVQDSPLDTNSRALVVTVATDPDPADGVYYYADAYTRASLNIGKPVGAVTNLSYDFQSNQVGGGAPRISLIFANGDVAYLAASSCNTPIAVSGGTWGRADFTGSTTATALPCTIYVTGITGGIYTSTATQSAWTVYATAHPTQVLDYDFMVWDEPGTWTVDRVSLGTGYMYNSDGRHAVRCRTEASC